MQKILPEHGLIRKLWVGDTAAYRDHLLRLDSDSRQNRFAGAVSDEFIRNYVDPSVTREAVIHGFWVDGCLRGAAELRSLGSSFAGEAEAAVSVEQAWQGRGVGSALLHRTLLAARNRGFHLLHMACLADNTRMQHLARKFGAELTFDFGGVLSEVEQARATPLSVLSEVMSDSYGVATAVFDIQSRLLRPA